jgi:integral membrane protein
MSEVEWLKFGQPPVPAQRVAEASGALLRYRIMAFATGVILSVATTALIMKAVGVHHMEPETGLLWLGHGYLYLVYVISTAILGVRLRWPLPRYVLVMAAGTIPTMSFVAEHFVTRAARNSATAEPEPATA